MPHDAGFSRALPDTPRMKGARGRGSLAAASKPSDWGHSPGRAVFDDVPRSKRVLLVQVQVFEILSFFLLYCYKFNLKEKRLLYFLLLSPLLL